MYKIALLSCHNLYESKAYFSIKLAEAFKRHDIEVSLFSWPYGPLPEEITQKIQNLKPDLTCSFHPFSPVDGKFFWDKLNIPHWTILVDPAFYDIELISSPLSIISCVDRSDVKFLQSYHFEKTFFWPHAVEKELVTSPFSERDIPIIFLGTCYDPENLRKYLLTHYPPEIIDVLEDAVSAVIGDSHTTFLQALMQALVLHSLDPHEVDFDQLAYYVDSYARGIDRLRLIRAIKHVPVHVYGSPCWREEKPIADWSYYLGKQSNVVIHPAVDFSEALQLLKRSKICLNSMPFFKNGTHERVFASLACGALPLTSDNLYMKEIFSENIDVLFYSSASLKNIEDTLQEILNDENQRCERVLEGQQKVLRDHTWDARVKQLGWLFEKTGNKVPRS